jgi:SAM-dependent methyltransferase
METTTAVCERVDHDRWKMAQTWERQHWLRDQKALARYGKNFVWRLLAMCGVVSKYRGNDRNTWWREHFDNYNFLPHRVSDALEVGCGPYTNIRLIRDVCRPDHLFLSDPLIRTYVKFRMTFVNELYRAAACGLDDHPLERLPFADNYFDLVVMINVLDHVQDAKACMERLIRVTKPGGFVIIGQDLTNDEDFRAQPDGLRTGHPITLDEDWFKAYLTENFDTVLHDIVPREKGWAPQWHYGTLVFSGTKRSRETSRNSSTCN